jgi:hypothetical protein
MNIKTTMRKPKTPKPVNTSEIARLVGRAVVIHWADPDCDWMHFRVERVEGQRVALTGMTDDRGNTHKGDFFWCNFSDMIQVALRA